MLSTSVKRGALLCFAAAAALVIVACGGSGSDGGGDSLAEGEPIVISSLTGPPEQGDEVMLQGMQIAADEINADGGVDGHQIEIESIPAGATPESVSAAYREAGERPEILGAFNGSGGGLAIRNLSETVKLPVITASGNDAVDRPVGRYVFANAETGPYATAPLTFEIERSGGESVAILHYEPDFDQQVGEAVEARCEDLGCEVTTVEEATSSASRSELIPRLTKMRASNPDMYMISELNANALKAARDLGMFDRPVLGNNYLANTPIAEATGKAGEDVTFASPKCTLTDLGELNQDDPMVEFCQNYRDAFKKKFPGEPLQGFSIYGYDAVNAFAAAAGKVLDAGDDLNRETLIDAMEDFSGEDLLGSGGFVESSPDNHRLVGPFEEGFVITQMRIGPDGPEYFIPEGADPAGSKP